MNVDKAACGMSFLCWRMVFQPEPVQADMGHIKAEKEDSLLLIISVSSQLKSVIPDGNASFYSPEMFLKLSSGSLIFIIVIIIGRRLKCEMFFE